MGAARGGPWPSLRALSNTHTRTRNTRTQGLYAPQFTPLYRGFNRSNGFLSGGEDHYTLAGDLGTGRGCDPAKGMTRDAFIENRTAPQVVGQYTGTRFMNAAVDYIRGHDSAAPLFMYLALHNTHGPIEAEPADIALYNATFPWGLQNRYYAMTTAVDRTVGAVVAELKSKGLWDNTLLIWTTDNGAPVTVAGSNGGLRGGKGSNWEGGVRERAIFSGGLVPPARRGASVEVLQPRMPWPSRHAPTGKTGMWWEL